MPKKHIPNSDEPAAFFNLDVILSSGYRVKTQNGTQFRQWATQRLKEYLVEGVAINEKRLAQKKIRKSKFCTIESAYWAAPLKPRRTSATTTGFWSLARDSSCSMTTTTSNSTKQGSRLPELLTRPLKTRKFVGETYSFIFLCREPTCGSCK